MHYNLISILLIFNIIFSDSNIEEYLWPTDASETITTVFGDKRSRRFHAVIDVRTYGKIGNDIYEGINLISSELKILSDQCRNLKIDKKELFGGSMTITSLGGIGGSFFTPIINFPEVAILGVGRSEKKQVFLDGKFVSRTMLPLSLSYDHRIIDGAEAARFNNELKENLGKNFAYKLAV